MLSVVCCCKQEEYVSKRPAGPEKRIELKKYQPTDTGIVPTNVAITVSPVWQDV
jgi:hypothetical protein